MFDIARLMTNIESMRVEKVTAGVASPREKSTFEFGRLNGYHEAMLDVLKLIEESLEEDDESGQDDNPFGRPLIR